MKFLSFPYHIIRWMMLARPIRFTRFGTFYILFSLGVGAAAINTGNNLLYLILGILLGFIVLSGFLSDSALWGIRTEWTPLGSLYTGQSGLMECRLHKGWFPGVAVTIESSWRGLPTTTFFSPWIPAHGSFLLQTEITPARRGHLALDHDRYSTRFPFGLFQKSHTRKIDDHWVVYPRIRRLPEAFWERQGKDFSRESSNRKGLGSVPFFLRDYRTGDPLRQVDWKTSAKRARLMVKEMEEEADEGDLLYLEAWPASLTDAKMEDFISFLASLIFCIYERGRPVGLIAPGCAFRPEASRAHLHRVLEFLALVDPSANPSLPMPPFPATRNACVLDVATLWRLPGR